MQSELLRLRSVVPLRQCLRSHGWHVPEPWSAVLHDRSVLHAKDVRPTVRALQYEHRSTTRSTSRQQSAQSSTAQSSAVYTGRNCPTHRPPIAARPSAPDSISIWCVLVGSTQITFGMVDPQCRCSLSHHPCFRICVQQISHHLRLQARQGRQRSG